MASHLRRCRRRRPCHRFCRSARREAPSARRGPSGRLPFAAAFCHGPAPSDSGGTACARRPAGSRSRARAAPIRTRPASRRFPGSRALPCNTFEGAIAAVREGRADLAMLPVENSTYGRIADIHHLLPESGLHIVGEHFVRVHANLLGAARHAARGRPHGDEPGAAARPVPRLPARARHRGRGSAPTPPARPRWWRRPATRRSRRSPPSSPPRSTGSTVLARHIEDQSNNTTRFLVMAPRAAAGAAARRR